MDSAQKTLIDIASVSKRVVNTLVEYTGRKTVESFRLDKIVVGSGAVLETLNKTLLKDGNVDDRLVDWLCSEEPRVCLHTLNQMEGILNKKLEYGVMNFFKASHSAHARDNSNEAIKVFQMREGYFHFLLSTDIWNCKNDAAQRPQTSARYNKLSTEDAIDRRDLVEISTQPDKSEYRSSVPQGNPRVYAEKLKTILKCLDAWNCKETHRRTILLRQPGTCAWLPNTNAFKTWRSKEDSFLWLHGKAGAGKSVLAASVIENLKSTLKDGEILVFFYCDFRNDRSTNAAEVMRSLLSQLLQHFRHNTVGIEDLIDNLVEEAEEGTLIISDVMVLVRYISRVAEQFSQQPFLVIDALDECKDVEELLDAFVELANGGIKLFVTSRSLQIIKDSLSSFPSVSMDTMKHEVQADITLHIMRELDSHRRLRIMEISLKEEIYSVLCNKAHGMFRWVHCQLNTLKRCMTALQVRRALDDLPNDLDATYTRILLRINDNEREVVQRALHWLVAALKPLELCQLVEGLSIDLGQRVMDRNFGPVHGCALLDALGSLVMHDDVTDIIALSHASVKDYLIAESTCTKHPAYHVDEQAAHTHVAQRCMCYIGIYLEQSQRSGAYGASPQKNRRTRRWRGDSDMATCSIRHCGSPISSFESHPLLAYVRSYGFQHLGHVNPGDKAVLRAIEAFQSDVRLHPLEWERLCGKSNSFNTQWPTLEHDLVLYILIAFAPASLLRSYIGRTQLKPMDGTNPLIYAASFGRIEHAEILLSRGVGVNHRGWDTGGTRRQFLPLEVAASRGNLRMVDLFLNEGSPVPHKLFGSAVNKRTPFPAVVSSLLQTDEFVEWATIIEDERRFLRALDPTQYICGYPSEEDIETIERRLIQIGCDPTARFDETSLRHAVLAGHVSTVKRMLSLNIPLPPDILLHASNSEMIHFLLDRGSDVHFVSPNGDTPLHLVMSSSLPEDECLENVQSLIDAGSDPFACNLAGETLLHVAAMYGCDSIIEYLLSLHVPLPPDILLVGSQPSTICSLLDEGADVHAIAANGDTVLHVALQSSCGEWDQCLDLATILIDAGCNPCLPNVLGETPFVVAAKMGHVPVVQYLLSLGIPFPSSILLSVAGSSTHEATTMLKFLIEKGADIHVTSPNGDTLLCVSITDPLYMEEESLNRAKILINAGCDARVVCNLAGETLFHVAARMHYISVLEYLLSLDLPVPSDLFLTQFAKGRSSQGCYRTIRFLLDMGGDIHTVTEHGDTLLHLAVRVGPEEHALDLAKLLVHSGCTPCVFNSANETPLHIASQYGYISVINYLLSLGQSLPSDILLTASTCSSESAEMIRYLIQEGANVSAVAEDGATPLHHLLKNLVYNEYDRLESVKILIDAGCDPRSQSLYVETPMHLAAMFGWISILEYLLSQGLPLSPDDLLASSARTIRFLLADNVVDVQSIAVNGDAHLLYRALEFPGGEEDCLERVRILIGAGWNPSSQNFFGETLMHVAARRNHISVIKYLHSQNATLPYDILFAAVPTDKEYWCTEDRVPLLRFLIREGANPNIFRADGDTPLHLAIRHNIDPGTSMSKSNYYDFQRYICLVEVLLDGGSDPSVRNADGKTAFDFAEEKGEFFKENFLRLVQNSRVHCT